MINKKIIKGIKNVVEKNKIRPALETVQIKNNVLTASDLYTTLKINGINALNGCYSIAQLENNCLDKIKFDSDDFPNIEPRKDIECLEINENILEGIKNTLFAVAEVENIACNGVRIESTGEKLIFISTDTFRMIKKEYNKSLPVFSVTIPEKTCKLITDILLDDIATIKIYNDRIEIFQDNIIIISRLIELCFPNWQLVYSNIYIQNTLEIDKKQLLETLKELLPIAKGNYNAKNGAVFEVVNNKIKVTASNDDMKKELIIDTVASVKNDCYKFALNIKFIVEYLKIADNEIVVKYNNEKSAFVINNNFLIMPLSF